MNSRERVVLALNHKEPDRVPIDLGATIVSSIVRASYVELMKYLGMPADQIEMLDHVQQLPYLDEPLLERFGVDFRLIQMPAATAPGLRVFEEGNYFAFIDRWGSRLHMPNEGGPYFDWVEFPISVPTMDALDHYAWPRPDPGEYTAQLRLQAEHLSKSTEFALVGSAIIGGGIFEQPARTMGMESISMALVAEPRFADRLMEQITEIYIKSRDGYLDQVGEFLQVFTYGDDLCGQNGWLVRPDSYRKMVKPKQRRLLEVIKKKTNAKVFYHICGASRGLIPDLIDLGFDIVNPVQVSARDMASRQLKKDFGADIVFCGGGVDTQHVLPFGTPDEVRDEVRRRIDDLAPGGGFVFAAVHNIQAFFPPENVVAAFDTALQCGRY